MSKPVPPMFNPAAEQAAFADALGGISAGDEDLGGFFDFLTPEKWSRVLAVGSNGDDVKRAQKKLAAIGFSVPTSGTYGSSTESAVRDFQSSQDIPSTGKIDEVTWDLLMKQGGTVQTMNTLTSIGQFGTGLATGFSASTAPAPPPMAAYEEVPEDETDWLLIGGVAVGGLVFVGGLAWLVSR